MEMPEINKRILQLIDKYTNNSVKKFAESIGIPQQTVNRLFNKDTRTGKYPTATTEILVAITRKYVNINANWLIAGKGDMLKTSPEVTNNKPLDQFQYTPTIPDSKKVDTTASELTLYIRELVSKIESLSRENGKLQERIYMITNDLRASGGGGILHSSKTISPSMDSEKPSSPADNPQR